MIKGTFLAVAYCFGGLAGVMFLLAMPHIDELLDGSEMSRAFLLALVISLVSAGFYKVIDNTEKK